MLNKFFVYQKALRFYKKTQTVKISNSVIRDQFTRACLSIVLNLSEGSGKKTKKDKTHFYSIARGSLRETQTLLDILDEKELLKEADELGALLHFLLKNPGGE